MTPKNMVRGWNAEVKQSVLVRTGHGHDTEKDLGADAERVVVVDDFPGAAEWILDR